MTTRPFESGERHVRERERNRRIWESKPLLRAIYRHFFEQIASSLTNDVPGETVEIGSGIGAIREAIPHCVISDLEKGPGVERVENIYDLRFADASVANLILFDVFHHLQFPAKALAQAHRVVHTGGRVVLLEPCVSALGVLVYGLAHREPLGLTQEIDRAIPDTSDPRLGAYYAAQANAHRIFVRNECPDLVRNWRIVEVRLFAALSYVLSGGYRSWQLYPTSALNLLRRIDRWCDRLPRIFATRMLAVLEKSSAEEEKV